MRAGPVQPQSKIRNSLRENRIADRTDSWPAGPAYARIGPTHTATDIKKPLARPDTGYPTSGALLQRSPARKREA